MPIPNDVRDDWADALESGEYQQGANSLAYVNGAGDWKYCCLGVLCEREIARGADLSRNDEARAAIRYGGETLTLPGSVQLRYVIPANPELDLSGEDWAAVIRVAEEKSHDQGGVDLAELYAMRERHDETGDRPALAEINDCGIPFTEIARLIRKYL